MERVPTTLRPLQDLGEVTAGTAPSSPDSIHSGAQGAPKSRRGGVLHSYCLPLSLAKPFEANFFSFVQERISRSSSFLPTRFQLASVFRARFGQRPTLSPPPFWKRPLLFSHFQPTSRLLFQQSSSPGLSGLLRHQSLVRAGSNLHSIPFTS